MTAVGFALLAFGALAGLAVTPERYTWDARDLFTTVPVCVGLLLILAGIVRWLWTVMP